MSKNPRGLFTEQRTKGQRTTDIGRIVRGTSPPSRREGRGSQSRFFLPEFICAHPWQHFLLSISSQACAENPACLVILAIKHHIGKENVCNEKIYRFIAAAD